MFIFVKRLRVSPIIQCSMLYLTSGLFLTQASFNLFLNGPIPASFCLFSSFFDYNINNKNWKKHRWCSWDSKPQPQDGRRRQNGAMVATQASVNLIRPVYNFLKWNMKISSLHLLLLCSPFASMLFNLTSLSPPFISNLFNENIPPLCYASVR